jgi:hypothetical protein
MIVASRRVLGVSLESRRNRRFLVLGYWASSLILLAGLLAGVHRHGLVWMVGLLCLQLLLNLPAILGGVRAGGAVKPYQPGDSTGLLQGAPSQTLFHRYRPDSWDEAPGEFRMDEREARLRDNTHFTAYTWNRWLALALFGGFELTVWQRPEWSTMAGFLCFFVLCLSLWSLPQTLILWNEPNLLDRPGEEE